MIIVVLFAIQKRGTASVGILFGPVMCVWFVVLAVLGRRRDRGQSAGAGGASTRVYAIALRRSRTRGSPSSRWAPSCSRSPAPRRSTPTWATSARQPIRRAWLFFVVPALVLNYFGQGALLLADPAAIKNPFYLLAPAVGARSRW